MAADELGTPAKEMAIDILRIKHSNLSSAE